MGFPAAGYISDNARTEGEQKTAFEDWLKASKQIPGAGAAKQALTIASGSVTPAAGSAQLIEIDTEGAASSDDLTNIVTTNLGVNSLVLVKIANNSRVVVVKNSAGGTGQMALRTAGDFTLAQTTDWILFTVNGTVLDEIARFPHEFTPAISAKSSTYTVTVADRNKIFDCTSTFTLNLPPAATAGKGFGIYVRNSGTGIITLDGNAGDTINGTTTLRLYTTEEYALVCDGTNWKTVGRRSGMIPIQSQVASAVATVDFTTGINSDFDEYVLMIEDLVPVTDGVDVLLRVSQSSSFISTTAYGHTRFGWDTTPASGPGGSNSDTAIMLASVLSNGAARAFQARIDFQVPSVTGRGKYFRWHAAYTRTSVLQGLVGMGVHSANTNPIDGVRILLSSGNISSGTFTLYGVRK